MDFLQFKLPLAGFGVILQAGAVLFTMAALVFSIREVSMAPHPVLSLMLVHKSSWMLSQCNHG